MIPIFAVTANQKTLYDNLVAVLKGAFVGVIDGNLLNLESVTKERYKVLYDVDKHMYIRTYCL